MSEAAAQRLHDAEKYFTAVRIEDGEVTLAEVNPALGYVGVRFLDDHGRRALDYRFRRQGDGRMFLVEMLLNRYGDSVARGDHATPIEIEHIYFGPDGVVRTETTDTATDEVETVDTHSVDVSSHWEAVPAFGDYDSIARHERE
ncbi:MAG TPA: hypothetical protein VM677_27850 [Actinokineospora sp.]|jgi:hypothetical protein|nr:hypothetical protein [Actinokineospora sp.]